MFEKVVDVIKEILGKPVVMKNRKELEKRMYDDIIPLGNDRDFNRYIVTNIKDMSKLFARSEETPFSDFNGKIDKWDVSNVTNMEGMFDEAKFNGDISKWNVSKVKNMSGMFRYSEFNGDISKWDVSNVTDMSEMFRSSKFEGDISNWDVSNVTNMKNMFDGSRLEKLGKLPPWYKAEPKKKVFRDEDVKVNNPVEDEEEDREEED